MAYTKAIFNGKMIDLHDFKLNQDNRAFRYGDGFFETLMVENGNIRLADYHIKRINRAFFAFELEPSEVWTTSFLQKLVAQLLSYSQSNNARLRINFWREAKGLYEPLGNTCHYLITIKPSVGKPDTILKQAGIYHEIPLIHHRLSPFKSLNSLAYVMAGICKAKKGWDEVILLSNEKMIADGGSTNVFWIRGSEVFTPSLKCGCIEGVMRSFLFDQCSKLGITLKESLSSEKELKEADAVFFSNVTGLRPLAKLGNKNFDVAHPIFEVLQQAARGSRH
jgi:branched-subunit amino acid aminotransferase/4-amino-4-deoxychorismate lyase